MMEETADRLVTGHVDCNRVSRVAQNLLESNRDVDFMKALTWRIHVVADDAENSFVLPVRRPTLRLAK